MRLFFEAARAQTILRPPNFTRLDVFVAVVLSLIHPGHEEARSSFLKEEQSWAGGTQNGKREIVVCPTPMENNVPKFGIRRSWAVLVFQIKRKCWNRKHG